MSEKAPMEKNIEVAYKDAIDNLLATKREQRVVAMLGVAPYVGIYLHIKSALLTIMLCFLVGAGSVFALVNFQHHIQKNRTRLRVIYMHYFSEEERDRLRLTTDDYGFAKAKDIFHLYVIVLVAAFSVVVGLKAADALQL